LRVSCLLPVKIENYKKSEQIAIRFPAQSVISGNILKNFSFFALIGQSFTAQEPVKFVLFISLVEWVGIRTN